MRKSQMSWSWSSLEKEKSLFLSSDYRSKNYCGAWEKAWLKEVSGKAVKDNISLYEAMWCNYEDKREHFPKTLFKFFPINHNSFKCIERNAVFVNNPKNFNDPFDGMICASENEYVKKCLIAHLRSTDAVSRGILSEDELMNLENSRCEDAGHYGSTRDDFDSVVFHLKYDTVMGESRKGDKEINQVCDKARKDFNENIEKLRETIVGISSFSNIDSFKLTAFMELWSHYAQNHEGFCVEYDLSKTIEKKHMNAVVLGSLLPCSYGTSQVLLSKNRFYKYANGIPLTSYEKMEFDKSIMLSFLKKSTSWKYENEWRIVLPKDICEIYENMIPFFPIKAIYLGCRIAKDNMEFLCRLAKRKDITIYQMRMKEYHFELEGEILPLKVDEYFNMEEWKKENRLQRSRYSFFCKE